MERDEQRRETISALKKNHTVEWFPFMRAKKQPCLTLLQMDNDNTLLLYYHDGFLLA
jgi:hypothetical protein